MGTSRPVAPECFTPPPGHGQPSEGEAQNVRLWLVEPAGSAYAARVGAASAELGLSVKTLEDADAAPPNAWLVGLGPSVPDPLQVARQLRAGGCQALLVFFTATPAARHSLQAELVRDPLAYPRCEIVELPDNTRQLANRMGKVVAEVNRRLHAGRSSRRGRSRRRAPTTTAAAAPTDSAESLLRQVLTHTRDAVLSTDELGRIVLCNPAAERLFRIKTSAGKRDLAALDRTGFGELADLIRQGLTSGQPREAQALCASVGGHTVQLTASIAPVHDARGAVRGVSVVAQDDSEYQRVQAALREANRQKDEFLAIISHELRTPLTSILGYTDMLLRGLGGPLAPVTHKYVSNVRAAGDRLLELVNGLLDYTRLQAGVERLELRAVDLRRLVDQVVQAVRPAADAKGVELSLALPAEADSRVEADEGRIFHVLRSMLSNAVKFTPAGGWVRVAIGPDPEVVDRVRVCVTDSGIGLRPEQIGRVWEQFYQGDPSLTRAHGGMGLGLSVARHLVELHGGSVGAESGGPDRGSTFWFSLPKRRRGG